MSLLFVCLFGTLLTAFGFFFAFLPWLMEPTECFMVSIPEVMQKDGRIIDLKRCYRNIMVIATALLLGGFLNIAFPFTPTAFTGTSLYQRAIAIFGILVTVVLAAIALGLMFHYRGPVREIRDERNWSAFAPEPSADDKVLLVPEQFNIGHAVNLSRQSCWALIAGFLALFVILFVVWLLVI